MNNEDKKPTRDLSDTELGQLTRAKIEGREIETKHFNSWVHWDREVDFQSGSIYRVKPETEFKVCWKMEGVNGGFMMTMPLRESTKYVEVAALELAIDCLEGCASNYVHIRDIIKRLEGLV